MLRAPSPRATLAALAIGACLLLVAGCTTTPPATSATGTATGVGSLGTAAPTRPASTPPPAATYPNSAEDYAKAAVAAWSGRDLTRLDQLEVQDGELHTLYHCNGCYDIHFTLVNCEGAAGSSYCLFFNNVGDSLRLRLVNQFLGQPRAIGNGSIWEPIMFPSDNKAYAQEALDAWQAGNDNRLKLLIANPPMTSVAITALGADPGAQWTFNSSSGAAGTTGYVWTNGAHSLVFLFTNGPVAPSTGPNSQHRIRSVIYTP
jgi:hypothetical protein